MGLLGKMYYTKPEQDSHVGYGTWSENDTLREDAKIDGVSVDGSWDLIGGVATAFSDENTAVLHKSPYHAGVPAKHFTAEDFDTREMLVRFDDHFLYYERIRVQSNDLLLNVVQHWTDEDKNKIIEHAKREHQLAIRMQRQGLGKSYGFFEGLAEQRKAEKNRVNDKETSTIGYTTQIFQVKEPIQSSEESDGVKTMQSNNVSGKTEIVFTDKKTYIQGNLPLAVSNIRILKDTITGNLTLTFDLTSASETSVSALMISADSYTVWGDILSTNDYQILDLKTTKCATIYDVAFFPLTNNEARKAVVKINKVAFADGTIQTRDENVFPIEGDSTYEQYIKDQETARAVGAENEKRNATYRLFSTNDSQSFVRAIRNSRNIFEVSKNLRDMSEKYPSLFSEKLLADVRELSRRQSTAGGDQRATAVATILSYLDEFQKKAGK